MTTPQSEPLAAGWTPNELARILRVSADKILHWIRSGELPAINTANSRLARPRYVVLPHHLEQFERKRAGTAEPPRPAPRRRRQTGLIDFFPDGQEEQAAQAPLRGATP